MFKSSEDFRRQKELEEARKAGLAPAEVDEEGKEINPHIPQYMTNAPWYLSTNHPTLKHQKDWRAKLQDSKQWYDRGQKVFQATKWRKGACENCGALSHETKDCLDRPRAKGARWTNKNIAADEKVEDLKLETWDAKRDRWNGFDAKDYERVVERYEAIDNLRRELKQKEAVERIYNADDDEKEGEQAAADAAAARLAAGQEDDDLRIDEDKIDDAEDAAFGEVKKRVRTTAGGASGSVRNLRIREDTAKYLINLDLNSAHYDPKSRSMREDPLPNKDGADKAYTGDNAIRKTGDYLAWQRQTMHALEAYDKGNNVHMQAIPSLAETLFQQYKVKKDALGKSTKEEVLEKYGAESSKAPEDLLLPASERYVEYDRLGRVVKGVDVKARSKYEEDVHNNNHTSVFGSWWKDGVWGYACCHQSVKNSYCIGAAGQQAVEATAEQMLKNMAAQQARKDEEAAVRAASKLAQPAAQADVWGSEASTSMELDAKKLADAKRKLAERDGEAVVTDERKRKYNSFAADDNSVSLEEMEAWRMQRAKAEDPMLAVTPAAAASGYDYV